MAGALKPPQPSLTDGVVRLRLLTPEDAAAVVRACEDPDIVRYTFMSEGFTEDQARTWIEQSTAHFAEGRARFAVDDPATGNFLGLAGMGVSWYHLSAEAYYWLVPDARGRGAATRALGLLADWAFDTVGVERLYLLVLPDNEPSHRVAERAGFTREGTLRAHQRFKGSRVDLVSWSLLPNDPRPWKAVRIRKRASGRRRPAS